MPHRRHRAMRRGHSRRALIVSVLFVLTTGLPFAGTARAVTFALSVDDVTVTEGDAGTVDAEFTVSLTPASPGIVTVDVFTANTTAVGGTDYVLVSEEVVFAPGETTQTVTVPVIGDEVAEVNETFLLRLANETGIDVFVADDRGIGTIVDDDLTSRLTIDDAAVPEDDNATFTVKLFPPSDDPVTVEVATANDTAVAPEDYENLAELLVFAPGETSETVTVDVNDDDLPEEVEETFLVQLENPTGGAVLADGEGEGTIWDDDVTPQLTIDNVEIYEGDHGWREAEFTVRLFPPSDERVTVDYATENDEAVSPDDYENTAGRLVFSPGETTEHIRVRIRGDEIDERDSDGGGDDDDDDDDDDNNGDGEDKKATREKFVVNLFDAVNAEIADDEGDCEIIDDDFLPVLNIDSPTVREGDGGTTDLRFTVTLFPTSEQEVRVDYATNDDVARAPGDYRAASGTLRFDPGEGRKTVTVEVKGDRLDEEDETVLVFLRDAVNAPIEEDEGEGTILDDDLAPSLTLGDATVVEGDKGSTEALMRAKLSEPSGQVVSFTVATGDDSAETPDDYVATTGTLSIPPGDTVIRFPVSVKGDDDEEEDEEFTVTLDDVINAAVAQSEAVVLIVEDDVPVAPRVTIVAHPSGDGYWTAAADGRVIAFGDAGYHGSVRGSLNRPIVAMAATPDGGGYWLTASDGGIFAFGNARFHGSAGAISLNQPVVGMAATPSGGGYWLVGRDGGIFSFGDAAFAGSTGALRLNEPIVAMAGTPDGEGYWLVASDGGIFAFGNAGFYGSTGAINLNRPITGMTPTPSGRGYWLVASDGGIFAFGNAFHGSTGAMKLNEPIAAMAASVSGYWLMARDGGVFSFGEAVFHGSTGGVPLRLG